MGFDVVTQVFLPPPAAKKCVLLYSSLSGIKWFPVSTGETKFSTYKSNTVSVIDLIWQMKYWFSTCHFITRCIFVWRLCVNQTDINSVQRYKQRIHNWHHLEAVLRWQFGWSLNIFHHRMDKKKTCMSSELTNVDMVNSWLWNVFCLSTIRGC